MTIGIIKASGKKKTIIHKATKHKRMRRMSSVSIPHKNTKLSTQWDMTTTREVLQEKQKYDDDDDIQPSLIHAAF